MKFFELGDIRVPVEANIDFRQTVGPVVPRKIKRYASGAAIRLRSNVPQMLKVTMSAGGYNPTGLDGLDWDAVHTLKCADPESVSGVGAANIITIPAARRSDTGYEPKGIAIVNGRRQFSPVAVVGDVCTVTIVAGAESYQVAYYREFDVLAEISKTGDLGWQIVAEQQRP